MVNKWISGLGTGVGFTAAVASVVLAGLGIINYNQAQDKHVEKPVLTTTATIGHLEDSIAASAKVSAQRTWQISAQGRITRDGLLPGVSVKEGGIVGVVAEQPIFVFKGTIPSYRSLTDGDHGPDVNQLQSGLARLGHYKGSPTSTFDTATRTALNKLYAQKGFTAPARIDAGSIVFDPQGTLTSTTQCGKAGQDASGVICALSGGLRLVLNVPIIDASRIKHGQRVVINGRQGTVSVAHKLTSTTNPVDGAPDNGSGKAVSFETTAPTALLDGLNIGEDLSADVIVASIDDALIVDASAIQDEGAKQWVRPKDGKPVEVRVTTCILGRCAISQPAPIKDGSVLIIESN